MFGEQDLGHTSPMVPDKTMNTEERLERGYRNSVKELRF